MPPADRTARERLGRLLAGRRAQISPRYANRRAFAADREMNWRTLHDIELAKRDNFRPETMRAFESAYMLVPGSLDRTLAGGELEPLPPAVAAPPPAPPSTGGDELRQIEEFIRLPPEIRRAVINLARAMEQDANGEETA
jgi:hypothetical protein